ncbi:hypothetical protein CAPTEDRAFT_184868 [Capitella teleta]|uniref:Uncharacterized protein n=1 Tax=Capitella teleta TaxID=283909 RepID=X1ZH69_CAPTE|nr:hypothetical protein CAPTEDRAFT_184868 [Capitella teleta]|eukprot:ELT90083.1 hypothetical protein CAPTEDRAFT_184868 [Capitella teleta]
MVLNCVAVSRRNYRGRKENLSFHRFLVDADRRSKWVAAMKITSARIGNQLLTAGYVMNILLGDVLMTCKQNLGHALARASEDKDALHIIRASKAIQFRTSLTIKGVSLMVLSPQTVKKNQCHHLYFTFVQMVLDGADLNNASMAAITISQLIMFNIDFIEARSRTDAL